MASCLVTQLSPFPSLPLPTHPRQIYYTFDAWSLHVTSHISYPFIHSPLYNFNAQKHDTLMPRWFSSPLILFYFLLFLAVLYCHLALRSHSHHRIVILIIITYALKNPLTPHFNPLPTLAIIIIFFFSSIAGVAIRKWIFFFHSDYKSFWFASHHFFNSIFLSNLRVINIIGKKYTWFFILFLFWINFFFK